MFINNWKKEIFTIPNMLSLFRLGLIPLYVTIYLKAARPEDYYLAAGILAVSCLTDLIDGKIARHFNMMSTVGQLLDPIADKATQFTLIICLAVRYPILWYLVCLFVVKEGFQLVACGLSLKKGMMLDGALFSGKICTTVLFVTLILLVMLPTLQYSVVCILTAVDALFMINAFVAYVLAYYGKNKKIHDIDRGK